jgi:hypothetical protein
MTGGGTANRVNIRGALPFCRRIRKNGPDQVAAARPNSFSVKRLRPAANLPSAASIDMHPKALRGDKPAIPQTIGMASICQLMGQYATPFHEEGCGR